MVAVGEELREVEELGNEFLYVGHVGGAGGDPGQRDAVEQSVRQIKVTSLKQKQDHHTFHYIICGNIIFSNLWKLKGSCTHTI